MRPALACLLIVLLGVSSLAAEGWQAGVATQNITPPELMWMAGYGGRDHPAEGKLTDLWAKALVLQDARGHAAALITLDLVGIDRTLSQRICRSLRQKHGLRREQVSICTSHTHAGPAVGRNLAPLHYLQVDAEQQQKIDDYAELLHGWVVELVGRALQDLAPAELAHGQGVCTFAVNRRENPAGEVEARRAEGTLQGPFDHDVPVLRVRGSDGQLRAVAFGYACHATTLSFYQWCGDYPGFAQQQLERRHPGCVALFWAGCGADQNPLPRRTVALAEKYGDMLADSVDAVLGRDLPAVAPRLRTEYREIELPLATIPSRDHWQQMTRSKNRFEAARAKMLLEKIDGGRPLATTYPYPVQLWELGEVAWVMLGGEVVVDYALMLKAQLGKQRPLWAAGYANDVMAYIPSRRVLREGGYEGASSMVYYGLPTVWAPELQKLITDTAAELLGPAAP